MSSRVLPPELRRLNVPRPFVPPQPIAPAEPSGTRAALGGGPSLRTWLTGVTGGALGPIGQGESFRHRDPVLALVHRITMGFTEAEHERAQALGFENYLEEQLEPDAIDDPHVEAKLGAFPVVGMSPKEVFEGYETRTQEAYVELKSARLVRAVHSRRQLQERLVEFWLDHFNIDHNKGLGWALLPEFERTVIRAHALGSFPAMLAASAFDAAMLFYLDNWLNVGSAPQENYARELLELHTLGVDGGYSEADVVEVARCFTGWTLNPDPASPDWMRGHFDPTQHSSGPKLVLGHVVRGAPAAGRPGQPVERDDAQAVLDIVAAHPSTARFLARKLLRRFLTPEPPAGLVERVAATYLATRGDIRAMMRVILTREHLSANAGFLAPKYRRPFHLLTGLLRTMQGNLRQSQEVALGHLVAMGHSPYDYPPPTGYPDDLSAWGGALLPRWVFVTALMGRDLTGIPLIGILDLRTKLGWTSPADNPGLAARIDARLLGGTLSAFEIEVLQQFIDGYPTAFGQGALEDTLALAASLPGSQWY
ncbi:MAG TPA: DUF1800 domain-containing protein [Planctomycetota bacterium]